MEAGQPMSSSFQVQDHRVTVTATVSTAGLSSVIDQFGYRPVAIDMSTAWTTGPISFLGGNDTAAMLSVYDSTAELSLSSAIALANVTLAFKQDFSQALRAHRYSQVRSGLAAGASTQAAARTLTLVYIPQ
jgi:hypothetical protein